MEDYTYHQVEYAEVVWVAKYIIGNASMGYFKKIVHVNIVKKLSPLNTLMLLETFFTQLHFSKSKKIPTNTEQVRTVYVNIPKKIMDLNKYVELRSSIIFINGVPFVASVVRKIKFTMIENIPRHTENIFKL